MRHPRPLRRRWLLASLLPTTLVLLLATIGGTLTAAPAASQPAPAATTGTGGLAGTVTDASGSPVSLTVVAIDTSTGTSYTGETDSSGAYTIGGLPTGTYDVEFPSFGYITQWWDSQPTQASANPVSVSEGTTVTGIDAVLRSATAAISGTVTTASGNPAGGVLVQAWFTQPDGSPYHFDAATDANGGYTISIPDPAPARNHSFQVEFNPYGANGLTTQWWNGQASQASANPIVLDQGQAVTGIDATLPPEATTGSITGTVTGPTGAALGGVTVNLYQVTSFPDPPTIVQRTTSATDGSYTFSSVAPNTPTGPFSQPYTVGFQPPAGSGLAPQYWNDQTDPGLASPITLNAGEHVAGIDGRMHRTAISGIVGGPSGRLPGATVVITNYYGFQVTQATTDAGGYFLVADLRPGVYRAKFLPPPGSGLLPQWWFRAADGAHSTPIGVAAGQNVEIGAGLEPAASITGTVSDAGGPVAGARATVFTIDTTTGKPSTQVGFTTTGNDGAYSVGGLAPGAYAVLFDAPIGSGDVGQWYQNTPAAATATPVSVDGDTATGIDARLAPGQHPTISGRVTDVNGEPIAGATALAVASDGRTGYTASTAADGTYTIAADLGSFTVWFIPPPGSNYRASVWDLSAGRLEIVSLDQATAATGINATLPSG